MGKNNSCIICYATDIFLWAVSECGHVCCLKCALRYKFIANKPGCPICLNERENDDILFKVVEDVKTPFSRTNESYLWAQCIICSTDQIPEIESILARYCKLCPTEFYDTKMLIAHYPAKHKRYLCELCVENRCELPSEYTVYDSASLIKHRNGKPPADGHPECGFCRERFYTQDILIKHCKRKHELCYLCEKLGKKNEFYKGYPELEKHFKKAHYICTERMCYEAKCYAFIDEVELSAHKMSTHPHTEKREQKIRVSQKREQRSISKPATAGRDKEHTKIESTVPEYLDRTNIINERNMKKKLKELIERNYQTPDKILELIETYIQDKITLSSLVDSFCDILGTSSALEAIPRIRIYLKKEKMEDIDKNFSTIKKNIEFSPFAKKKPEKEANPSDSQKNKVFKAPQKIGWGSALTRNSWNNAALHKK